MRFDFFTLGGSQFWEDVFFYQKWRIQRNYKNKKYRLLDNWDIRRAEGTFNHCRNEFLRFIEIYQLSRQRGHMVIMLHGMGESKNIFKPLWREVMKFGLMAAAVNYPSTCKRLDAHVRQLDFFMNHLEDVKEVSFVTHGAGSLVLRKMLNMDSPWLQKLKIKRIVEVCPENNGRKLYAKLAGYKVFRWLFGPMLNDLTPKNARRIPPIPSHFEVGTIELTSPLAELYRILPEVWLKKLPFVPEKQVRDGKFVIAVKNMSLNVFKNPEVLRNCTLFLTKGKF